MSSLEGIYDHLSVLLFKNENARKILGKREILSCVSAAYLLMRTDIKELLQSLEKLYVGNNYILDDVLKIKEYLKVNLRSINVNNLEIILSAFFVFLRLFPGLEAKSIVHPELAQELSNKAKYFYTEFTEVGSDTFAKTAVSMKTTSTKSIDSWLGSNAVKNNIDNLKQAVGSGAGKGITWNGKTIFYSKAEIHIYMPKDYITPDLKKEWLDRLVKDHPTIKFEINALEDFVQ